MIKNNFLDDTEEKSCLISNAIGMYEMTIYVNSYYHTNDTYTHKHFFFF